MKRRSLVALSLVVGLTAMPRSARADHHGGGESLAFLLIGLLVVDAAFVTYDTIVVAQNDHPARGACIAEAIVGVPQVLLYTALVPEMKARGATGLISAVATLPMFNSVHGIWGAASPKTRPGTLYGASWGTAADLSFTMPAVAQAVRGHLVGVGSGVGEMIATAPQIAVATPTAIHESGTERTAWYALDGWAAALFVHGAVSTAVGTVEDDVSPPPPPPEPPPPEPAPSGPLEIEPPEPAPKPTGRFIVPGTVSLRPMALPGGAGVSLGAVLW